MKKKILITRKIMDSAEERLKSNFDVLLNEKDIPIKNEDFAKVWASLSEFRKSYKTWKDLGFVE